MPCIFSSSATAMTSIAWRRLSIASIASKISRWAGRKKSSTPGWCATSSNAAGLMNTDPSTDFSASRLCGGVLRRTALPPRLELTILSAAPTSRAILRLDGARWRASLDFESRLYASFLDDPTLIVAFTPRPSFTGTSSRRAP